MLSLLLTYNSENTYLLKKNKHGVLIAVLLIVAGNWKQPKSPLKKINYVGIPSNENKLIQLYLTI